MPKERIVQELQNMFRDAEYGFEVFVRIKNQPMLKRLVLYEGDTALPGDDNFKKKVEDAIAEAIRLKYLAEDAEYAPAEHVADNQQKFYVIKQNEEYSPFAIALNSMENIENFQVQDRVSAEGILFRFRRDDRSLWAYQHIYAMTIPNKKKKSFLSVQQDDVFVEMKVPLFTISKKVDLLLLGDEIITDNISLMQRNFGFQEFIRSSARTAISNIGNLHLIANIDKLSDYVERGPIRYKKKMMRIKNSKVFELTSDALLYKIRTLPRWRGKFVIENNKIILNTYVQVESLIELLDETYTRSDVTGEEYETDVKKLAEPVG